MTRRKFVENMAGAGAALPLGGFMRQTGFRPDTWPAGVPLPPPNGPVRPPWQPDSLIDRLFQREAGYSNDPADTPTNHGITQATLSEWLGRPASIEEVYGLSEKTARQIYKQKYLHDPKIGQLPDQFREQVFDMGVLAGPATAVGLLQQTLNRAGTHLPVDNLVGPATINNAEYQGKRFGPALNNAYADAAIAYVKQVAEREPKKRKFLKGWIDRINSFRDPYLR